MWAARNLKFLPLSFKQALFDPNLSPAKNMTVPIVQKDGSKVNQKIIQLSNWQLLNLEIDDILSLSDRLYKNYSISRQIYNNAISPYLVQSLGMFGIQQQFQLKKTPIVFVTQSAHYSWPKAATVLGIGLNNLIKVPVDKIGRMQVGELRKSILKAAGSHLVEEERTPIIMVMGITGSTEESCVDPISEIVELRNQVRREGISFWIHSDCAWGGYFCSLLRDNDQSDLKPTNSEDLAQSLQKASYFCPFLPLSTYVESQLLSLKECDSITIDPHKSGYIQYPAGGLVYRNGTARTLVNFDAPIVYHGQDDATIGVFGIEGSKPGAAPAAVYLSHRSIGLYREGYGMILGQANLNCKRLYCVLITMAAEDDPFIVEPFTPVSESILSKFDHNLQKFKDFVRHRILKSTNEDLIKDIEAFKILREIGPDLLINAFAINYKLNGQLNTLITKATELMNYIFQDLDMAYMIDSTNNIQTMGVMRKPLFFTSSSFESDSYGLAVNELKRRLGLNPDDEKNNLSFLVNTVMDPWISGVHFTPTIQRVLRSYILKSIGAVTDSPDIHGFLCIGNENALFWHHFPMFSMPNHQYQVTIVADFVSQEDRNQFFSEKMLLSLSPKNGVDNNLVVANHLPLTIHEIVFSKTPIIVDCYHGMPLSPSISPPSTPFMTSSLIVKDFVIFDHFDPKANFHRRLTYLLFGRDGDAFMEHLISKEKNFDHVLLLKGLPEGISQRTLELGILITINGLSDDFYEQNPLANSDTWDFEYFGEGGKSGRSTLIIERTIWFNSQRLNAHESSL